MKTILSGIFRSGSGIAELRQKGKTDWFRLVVLGLSLAILVVFIAYPIFSILGRSLVSRGSAVAIGNVSLENFARLGSSRLFRDAILNSLVLTVRVVLASTVIGVVYAYILARVKLPVSHTLMMTLGTIPLLMPPFIGAYSWVVLFGRSGAITGIVEALTPFTVPSMYGMTGMTVAITATMWPFVFLLAYGALALNDPSLEESADVMGASPLRKLLTVTVPLVTPAVLTGSLIVFMRAIGDFGTPAILGGNIYVIPTLIYFRITGYGDFHGAGAMALVSITISLLCLGFIGLYLRRRDYTTVTSRVQAAKKSDDPLLRWGGTIVCLGILAFSLLPQATVVLGAFAERWRGTPFPEELGFENFSTIFTRDRLAMENSLLLAITATLVATIVGTLLAYIASRKKTGKGSAVIDLTVMLPFILPGIVVGVAMASAFSEGPIILTGTGAILIVAYFVRRMPYGFRSASSSLRSLDNNLEEASTVTGASWYQTSRLVVLPLIMPGVIAGAVLTFITLIGELSATVILYSGRWKPMSISIYEYLISHRPGPAFALGTVLIVIVFFAVFLVNRLLGVAITSLFRGK